jgi:S-formylglutathione hydrolase
MSSQLERGSFEHESVPGPVEYTVLVPEGQAGEQGLPLLLHLHGGGSSCEVLADRKQLQDQLWDSGVLPPMIVACASTPTVGGYYVDADDGSGHWETVISRVFRDLIVKQYGVDDSRVALIGISMGGYGALKLALREPHRYVAVAGLAPAVFPGRTSSVLTPRTTFGAEVPRLRMLGEPPSEEHYRHNHPVSIAERNADNIKTSGLAIYLECGDRDAFNLHDGTEYLHRVLWELDIPHEYRLVLGADHVGPTLGARFTDAHRFIADAVRARHRPVDDTALGPEEYAYLEWAAKGFIGTAPTLDPTSARAPTLLRTVFAAGYEAALDADPTTRRRYLPMGH